MDDDKHYGLRKKLNKLFGSYHLFMTAQDGYVVCFGNKQLILGKTLFVAMMCADYLLMQEPENRGYRNDNCSYTGS